MKSVGIGSPACFPSLCAFVWTSLLCAAVSHGDNLGRDLSRRSSRPREPLEIRREPIGATVDYVNSLTIKVVRDGRICVLTLGGDLDFLAVPGFLMRAAQVIDEPTERFVLNLAGLTFLDCAGARALAAVTDLLPGGCPVIIRSLNQILDLLNMDLRQEPSVEDGHGAGLLGQPGGSAPQSQHARPAGRPAARLRAGEQ